MLARSSSLSRLPKTSAKVSTQCPRITSLRASEGCVKLTLFREFVRDRLRLEDRGEPCLTGSAQEFGGLGFYVALLKATHSVLVTAMGAPGASETCLPP